MLFRSGDTTTRQCHVIPPILNPLAAFYSRLRFLQPLFHFPEVELPPKSSVLSSETRVTSLDLNCDMKTSILRALNDETTYSGGTSNAVWCVYFSRCNYATVTRFFTGDYVFGYSDFVTFDFLRRFDDRLKEWKKTINNLDRLEEALMISYTMFLKTLDDFFLTHQLDLPLQSPDPGCGNGFLNYICVAIQSELHVIRHGELYQKHIRRIAEAK